MSFVYAADPCQRSLSGSESLRTGDHILLSQIWDFPFRRLLRLEGSRWRYSTPPPNGLALLTECESSVTTDGQSASVSWDKAPIWGLRPLFITIRHLLAYWCGALSLTRRRVCRLQLLLVFGSAVILESESRGTSKHILLSQIDFPFCRLLRLAGLRWRYSTRLHMEQLCWLSLPSAVIFGGRTVYKTPSRRVLFRVSDVTASCVLATSALSRERAFIPRQHADSMSIALVAAGTTLIELLPCNGRLCCFPTSIFRLLGGTSQYIFRIYFSCHLIICHK
jgi:hypothetical protein